MSATLGVAPPVMATYEPIATNRLEADRPARPVDDQISVLVVEEHDVSRCGLRLILCSQPWVGRCLAAPDLATATDCIRRGVPDVILYAARPGLDQAREACRELRDLSPDSILLLMSSANRVTAQTLNSVDAYGHVSKNSSARQILRAVRLASLGIQVGAETPVTLLSARQQEVLELLAAGETNSEIARRLYLSAHTVKQHTCAIYRKLQVRNRAEAIRRAQGLGLLA